MTITLPDELAERLRNRALEQGVSVETLLAELLDEEWEESELEDREDEAELTEIRNAIEESLEEFDRGESHPAEVVFAELRRRHGLPH